MVDPIEDLIGLFLAQREPFAPEGLGNAYWSLICQALIG